MIPSYFKPWAATILAVKALSTDSLTLYATLRCWHRALVLVDHQRGQPLLQGRLREGVSCRAEHPSAVGPRLPDAVPVALCQARIQPREELVQGKEQSSALCRFHSSGHEQQRKTPGRVCRPDLSDPLCLTYLAIPRNDRYVGSPGACFCDVFVVNRPGVRQPQQAVRDQRIQNASGFRLDLLTVLDTKSPAPAGSRSRAESHTYTP